MPSSVPELLDDVLTPEWLTGALRTRFPGTIVAAVPRGPVISRVATDARFRIEGASPRARP